MTCKLTFSDDVIRDHDLLTTFIDDLLFLVIHCCYWYDTLLLMPPTLPHICWLALLLFFFTTIVAVLLIIVVDWWHRCCLLPWWCGGTRLPVILFIAVHCLHLSYRSDALPPTTLPFTITIILPGSTFTACCTIDFADIPPVLCYNFWQYWYDDAVLMTICSHMWCLHISDHPNLLLMTRCCWCGDTILLLWRWRHSMRYIPFCDIVVTMQQHTIPIPLGIYLHDCDVHACSVQWCRLTWLHYSWQCLFINQWWWSDHLTIPYHCFWYSLFYLVMIFIGIVIRWWSVSKWPIPDVYCCVTYCDVCCHHDRLLYDVYSLLCRLTILLVWRVRDWLAIFDGGLW